MSFLDVGRGDVIIHPSILGPHNDDILTLGQFLRFFRFTSTLEDYTGKRFLLFSRSRGCQPNSDVKLLMTSCSQRLTDTNPISTRVDNIQVTNT